MYEPSCASFVTCTVYSVYCINHLSPLPFVRCARERYILPNEWRWQTKGWMIQTFTSPHIGGATQFNMRSSLCLCFDATFCPFWRSLRRSGRPPLGYIAATRRTTSRCNVIHYDGQLQGQPWSSFTYYINCMALPTMITLRTGNKYPCGQWHGSC